MSVTRRQARSYCKKNPQTHITPQRIGAVLGLSARQVPASVLPLTGSEVLQLAAREDPPAWVRETRDANTARRAARAERRWKKAAEFDRWMRDDLIAEYMLSGLKDGLTNEEAHVRAVAACNEVLDTIGTQAAGELVLAGMVARAGHIEESASRETG